MTSDSAAQSAFVFTICRPEPLMGQPLLSGEAGGKDPLTTDTAATNQLYSHLPRARTGRRATSRQTSVKLSAGRAERTVRQKVDVHTVRPTIRRPEHKQTELPPVLPSHRLSLRTESRALSSFPASTISASNVTSISEGTGDCEGAADKSFRNGVTDVGVDAAAVVGVAIACTLRCSLDTI